MLRKIFGVNYMRYVLVNSFLNLGDAPLGVGGCDGVEVAALCQRRPPGHVRMRWRGGSRSLSALSTQACKDAMV